MLSIVTGTLNRKRCLPKLINNTVESDSRVELVLVDGGSTDGTLNYLREINHPQIKLIEVGCRSSYPHFMNLGIRKSSYEYICQWNDDVLLVNPWSDVIDLLDGEDDAYIFSWQYGVLERPPRRWNLVCDSSIDEVVMNYGVYKKDVFRKIGLYNNDYFYYYADGDMSYRTWAFGLEIKPHPQIKVISLLSEMNNKIALFKPEQEILYKKLREQYKRKELPTNLEYLN